MIRNSLLAVILAAMGACRVNDPSPLVDVHDDLPPLRLTMTRANDGQIVTDETYRGRTVALYFGYTHCPDLCPMTLSNLSEAMSKLGPLASRVSVLFVTVDPARDDLATLRSYAAGFGSGFEALRGTPDEIIALTRRYRVAFTAQPKNAAGDYDVSHSSAVYVIDGTGQARFVITSTDNIGAVTEGLKKLAAQSPANGREAHSDHHPA